MSENPYELLYMIRTGSEEALAELLEIYDQTVQMLAKKCVLQHSYCLYYYDDLISEGISAVEKAAYGYREDRSASFNTYAIVVIKRNMWNRVREHEGNDIFDPHKLLYYQGMYENQASAEGRLECRDAMNDPSYHNRYREAKERLDRAMASLTTYERTIYEGLLNGQSRRSMIEKLGCTAKAYDGRLRRMRDKARLAVYGENEFGA